VRTTLRSTLGTSVVMLASAALSTVAAQGAGKAAGQATGPTACSIIDVAEMKRITGRTDYLKRGPVPADPNETPKGVSECEFLGISFSLTSAMKPDWFNTTRSDQVKSGTKVEPVSGVGDEAYYWWDPKPGSDRQVGVAFRAGSYRLVVMDMTSADSIQAMKPVLLAIAKMAAPKLR
jgi:hypothetical protein